VLGGRASYGHGDWGDSHRVDQDTFGLLNGGVKSNAGSNRRDGQLGNRTSRAITERRWSEEPDVERFTHEWDMNVTEVDYYLREFRRAFPVEHSPTRIMHDVRASLGQIGVEGIQSARLDVVRP
jgi:hypothetical protein